MGSASSKAVRQFPKTSKAQPTWAGARTPSPGEGHSPVAAQADAARASATRTADIERDARDPQFMANLSRLGPVRVDHHMKTYRVAADKAQQVVRAQQESEMDADAPHPPHNRLHASTLQELLAERKEITTRAELAQLCERYGVDVEKLESVARFVNSPSIDPDSVRRVLRDDGMENTTMKATWIDPPSATQTRPLLDSST